MELESHKFACVIAQFLDDKLGKNITIELIPSDLIEGTACQTQSLYSFGGLV